MIDLGCQQMIQHVHGGRKEHALIRLTGAPADDLREKGLANTGIADKDRAGPVLKELQIEQAQNSGFLFRAALMVFEVKAVNRMPGMQTRQTEAAFDGTAVP